MQTTNNKVAADRTQLEQAANRPPILKPAGYSTLPTSTKAAEPISKSSAHFVYLSTGTPMNQLKFDF